MVTQAGLTIPSDIKPSTFWITSPLTIVTENSAAGSDGMGIWYIFADKVTGPSGNETGFYEDGEAFRTAILPFERNTVHSNVDSGFMFGFELLRDQVLPGVYCKTLTLRCSGSDFLDHTVRLIEIF